MINALNLFNRNNAYFQRFGASFRFYQIIYSEIVTSFCENQCIWQVENIHSDSGVLSFECWISGLCDPLVQSFVT